jgi:hypothetical protein
VSVGWRLEQEREGADGCYNVAAQADGDELEEGCWSHKDYRRDSGKCTFALSLSPSFSS